MASPRCQKTRPYNTRTPCQEVPEGLEPWTRPVPNVAFWFEENKVQKWHPQDAKKRAPTTPNTLPGGARRLRTMDTAGA